MTLKRCARCRQEKPTEAFYPNRAMRDGLTPYCRPCKSEYEKARRAANLDTVRATDRARYERNREAEAVRRKAAREVNPERFRAANNRYYEAHKEKVAARIAAYRAEDPERWKAYGKAHYEANKERLIARQLERYHANAADISEQRKVARAANPEPYRERNREWAREHPDQSRAKRRRRRARLATNPAEPYSELTIYERDAWRCQLCGWAVDPELRWPDPDSASIDHVVPVIAGGADTPGNVQLAHLHCNQAKGTRRAATSTG